jgi:hypothetical protein
MSGSDAGGDSFGSDAGGAGFGGRGGGGSGGGGGMLVAMGVASFLDNIQVEVPQETQEELGKLLQELQKSRSTPEEVERALERLTELANSSLALNKRLGELGFPATVTKQMKTHQHNAPVQAAAGRCLGALCMYPSNRNELATIVTCEQVVKAMRTHKQSQEVQIGGCEAIQGLIGGNTDCSDQFGELGACELVVEALERWPMESEVVIATSGALGSLAHECPNNKTKVGNIGGCALFMGAMKRMKILPNKGVAACWTAVGNLADRCPPNGTTFHSHGACDLLGQMMRKHLSDVELQLVLLPTARKLANSGDPVAKEAMGTPALTESLVGAINVHEGYSQIQGAACEAMALIGEGSVRNSQALLDAGAGEALLKVLATPAYDDTSSLRRGVAAISALAASDPTVSDRLSELDTCEGIVRVMEEHPADGPLQLVCCDAMGRLAAHHASSAKKLGDVGACELLLGVFRRFAKERSLRIRACEVAALLSSGHAKNAERFRVAGAPDVLTATMQAFPQDLRTQAGCCQAVTALASNDRDSTNLFGELGTADAIITALRRSISAADGRRVQELGAQALGALVVRHPENNARLRAAGACEMLVGQFYAMKDDTRVLTRTCEAVGHMALGSTEGSERLADAGACEGVVETMRRHPADAELQTAACYAVHNLAAASAGVNARLGQAGACGAVMATAATVGGSGGAAASVEQESLLCDTVGGLAGGTPANAVMLREAGACKYLVDAMTRHAANPVVQVLCCAAAAKLASGDPPRASQELESVGGCEALMQAIHNHAADPRVQLVGWDALRTMAVTDPRTTGRKFFVLGVHEVVVAAMGKYKKDAAVQARLIEVTGALAELDADFVNVLGASGVCAAVFAAMRKFQKDSKVQHLGCSCLRSLCLKSRLNTARIAEEGGLELLIASNVHFPGSVPLYRAMCNVVEMVVQAQVDPNNRVGLLGLPAVIVKGLRDMANSLEKAGAIEALRSITAVASAEPRNRLALGESNAAAVVLSTLRAYTRDPEVWPLGITCVRALGEGCPDNVTRLSKAGACDLVAGIWKTFPDNSRVQLDAIAMAGVLAERDPAENVPKLAYSGACEALISTMKRFPQDWGVQARGLRLLSTLACAEQKNTRKLGGEAEVAALVNAVLKRGVGDAGVQTAGLGATRDLMGCQHTEYTPRLIETGTYESVVAAMKSLPEDKTVNHQGAEIMQELLKDTGGDSAGKLGNAGAAEVLLPALDLFSEDVPVAAVILDDITNLSARSSKNRKRFVKAGIPGKLSPALRSGLAKDTEIFVYCCDVCRALCYDNAEAASKFAASDFPGALAAAWGHHTNDAAAQLKAFKTVDALTSGSRENMRAVSAAGGCELIVQAMTRFPADQDLQLRGCALIQRMASPPTGTPGQEQGAAGAGGGVEVIERLGKAGACAAVLDAARNHSTLVGVGTGAEDKEAEEDPVTAPALDAAVALSESGLANRRRLGTAGGADMVVGVVRASLERSRGTGAPSELLRRACTALRSLTTDDAGNAMGAINAGAPEVLVGAIVAFASDPEVFVDVSDCVASMVGTRDPGVQARLAAAGMCTPLLKGVDALPLNVTAIVKALGNVNGLLASVPELREALGETGGCAMALQILRRFMNEDPVRSAGLETIQLLARKFPPNRTRLGEAGACETVMSMWKSLGARTAADPAATAEFCATVSVLAEGDPPNGTRLGAAGACELVLEGMRKHADDRVVQTRGCSAIATLAATSIANTVRMVAGGACEVVGRLFKSFAADAEVLPEVCFATGELANVDPEASEKLGALGAVDQVLKIMTRFSSDAVLMASALRCVEGLVRQSQNNCRRAVEEGGVEAVATVMRQEKLPADVFASAEQFLGLLIYKGSSLVERPRLVTDVRGAGVVALLTRGLERFREESPWAVRSGLGLAVTVVALEPGSFKREMSEAGTVDQFAAVMASRAAASHSPLFLECCRTTATIAEGQPVTHGRLAACGFGKSLVKRWKDHFEATSGDARVHDVMRIVSEHPDIASAIGDVGGVEALVAGLRRHPFDQSVNSSGWRALNNLCGGSSPAALDNAEKAAAAEVSEPAVQALKTYNRQELAVATLVVDAISTLGPLAASQLGSAGACEALLEHMSVHAKDLAIQTRSCVCMARLTGKDQSENASALVRGGAVTQMADGLQAFPADVGLYVAVLEAISAFAASSFDPGPVLESTGMYRPLLNGLEALPLSSDATLKVLDCITSLASVSLAGREMLGEQGACASVLATMKRHLRDDKVRPAVCQAIRALALKCPANRGRLGEAGACETIVSMWTVARHAAAGEEAEGSVQAQADYCDAVGILAAEDPQNSGRLGRAGGCKLVVESMKDYPSERRIQAKGCYAVAALGTTDPENASRLGGAGEICGVVAQALQGFEEDAEVMVSAIEATGIVADADPSAKLQLSEMGALDAIVGAMQRFPEDGLLQNNACTALTTFALNDPDNAAVFLDLEGGVALVDALTHFPFKQDLNASGFALIQAVASTGNSQCGRLGRESPGLGDALAAALRRYYLNPEVFGLLIGAITALAGNAKNRKILGDADVSGALGPPMKKLQDPGMKQQLVDAIRALALKNTANKKALGAVGACDFTIGMWKASAQGEQGDEAAADQLDYVDAMEVLSSGNAANADRFGGGGGCGLLVASMTTHETNRDLQLRGFQCAATLLSANPDLADTLTVGLVYPVIMRALRNHPDDVDLEASVCELISIMASGEEQSRLEFGEAGACELVVEIMRAYPDDVGIQGSCCEAIGFLAQRCGENSERLLQAGACELVPAAMLQYPDDETTQSDGLLAIGSLSSRGVDPFVEAGVALGEAGACEAMMKAVFAFDKNETVLSRALDALPLLAPCSPENRTKLGEAGACRFVSNALRSIPDDPAIQQLGCGLVAMLGEDNSTNMALFRDAGTCELLRNTLKAFPNDVDIVGRVVDAVRVLSGDAKARALFGTLGLCGMTVQLFKSSRSVDVQVMESTASLAVVMGNSVMFMRTLASTLMNSIQRILSRSALTTAVYWAGALLPGHRCAGVPEPVQRAAAGPGGRGAPHLRGGRVACRRRRDPGRLLVGAGQAHRAQPGHQPPARAAGGVRDGHRPVPALPPGWRRLGRRVRCPGQPGRGGRGEQGQAERAGGV